MILQKHKISCFILASAVFFGGGCASVQQTKRTDDLEKQLAALKEAVKAKDLQTNRLRTVLDDQVRQLRDLSEQLNECRKGPVDLRKRQPNLK